MARREGLRRRNARGRGRICGRSLTALRSKSRFTRHLPANCAFPNSLIV
jgi:hypothetical protein